MIGILAGLSQVNFLHKYWCHQSPDWEDFGSKSRSNKEIWDLKFKVWDVRVKIWESRFEIRDLRFEILNLRFEIRDLTFEIWELRFEIQDLRFKSYDSRSKIWGLRFEVWDLRFEIRDSRFKIWFSELWEQSDSSLELEFHPGKSGQTLGRYPWSCPRNTWTLVWVTRWTSVPGWTPWPWSSFPTSTTPKFCDHPTFHISITIQVYPRWLYNSVPTILVFPDPTGKQNMRSRYQG